MKENNLPKIYQVTGLIAFIYSVMLLAFAIYKHFLYIDGTWFHGFTANGFAVFNGLIWIGILVVFKQLLNKILNYRKANLLINAYLIFAAISVISVASVLYKSVKVYLSLEDTENLNALTGFSSTSILGAIFLFISNFAIILICILLGNRIRKIDIVENKLFQIFGFSFIGYGIISLLGTINVIENETFQFLINAALAIMIGMIFKKMYYINSSYLHTLAGFEKGNKIEQVKLEIKQNKKSEKFEERVILQNKAVKEKVKEANLENEELPNINLDEFEDKKLVISYFENLSKEELNRLENIVESKYNRNLTKEQKNNLVIHYIVKNKMYDHQRFLPK